MEYIKFSLFFILAHTISYLVAGVIALSISKDIYKTKSRHCDFLRDMSDKDESRHVSMYFIPAQIVRGALMSIILFPLLSSVAGLSFAVSAVFFGSLLFVYTHIAAVSPFIDNIEGYVYFKKEYLMKKYFLKFQLEMVLYCILFGLSMAFLMGFVFQNLA
jgi:hypothetical protein